MAPRDNRKIVGFSLVEVLVALVVLGVGLLGLAGLQSSSLKAGNDAYLRTQANMLAYNMIDRMRSNKPALVDDDYEMAETDAPTTFDSCPAVPSTFTSAAALAKLDKDQWLCALGKQLPDAKGAITTTASGDHTQITVTVSWLEKRVQTSVDAESTSLKVTTLL